MRTKLALLVASLLGLSVLIISNQEASASTSTSKQIANLKKQIKELEGLVDSLTTDVDALSGQIDLLTSQQGSIRLPAGYEEKTIRFVAIQTFVGGCPSGTRRAELFGTSFNVPTRPAGSSGNYNSAQTFLECQVSLIGK